MIPGAGTDRFGARVLKERLPVFRRQSFIRSQSAHGWGLSADGSGHLLHLPGCRHAPARGAVGHDRLEHIKNNKVESVQNRKWGK